MKYDLRIFTILFLAAIVMVACNKKKHDVLVEEEVASVLSDKTNTPTTSSQNTGRTKVNPTQDAPPPPPPPPPPAPSDEEEEVFKVVEEMPRFPGCENLKANTNVVSKCAKEKMQMFLGKHMSYPEAARKEGVEGKAIARFIVNPDGSISDIDILRDPGAGIGKELVRVIEMMNQMDEKWIPGKQRGRPVRVMWTLPFSFSL